jgi:hypothetical protein
MVASDQPNAQPRSPAFVPAPYPDRDIGFKLARARIRGDLALVVTTLEVRWFVPGSVAEHAGIESWFRTRPIADGSGGPAAIDWDPAPPAWRQDRYLVVPGHDDMGIKWRDGRLEIKGREAALGHTAFAPGTEGMCERWLKWSYAGAAIEQRFLGLFQGGAAEGVVLVEKRRLQRHLRLDPALGPVEVGSGARRERGVNLELAQIRMPGSRIESHWSLAFEAFPGDLQMPEPFAQIVAGFLDGCPVLPLSAERSMAYPRWLRDLDRPAATSD